MFSVTNVHTKRTGSEDVMEIGKWLLIEYVVRYNNNTRNGGNFSK